VVAKNTFSGGQKQDISKELQKDDSYRYAMNGRIRFNKDKTAEFCTELGTLEMLSPCGYRIVGAADFETFTVLLSTDGVLSEIGIFEINNLVPKYTTLFNDLNDPNGDRLAFKDYVECISVSENSSDRRVYLGGDSNEARVINLKTLYDGGLPIHFAKCGEKQSYPKSMSVHSFASKPDVFFGRLKYIRTIEGNIATSNINSIGALKTGAIQYTYRYKTRDGYNTPWFPPIPAINITSSYYSDNGKPIKNHHQYVMKESNLTTQKSIEIEIENLDNRFYEIEVAYIYSIASSPIEFNVFERTKLSGTPSLKIIHYNHGGVSAGDVSELNAIQDSIKSIQTISSQNNKLLFGGVTYAKDIEFDVKGAKINPIFKQMLCDENGIVTYKGQDDVITNTKPINHTQTIQSYVDKNGAAIVNSFPNIYEYPNYKGTRFEHLFTSYWRGEVYPIYAVAINRKGYHSFAMLIEDYKFPEQWNNKDGNGIDARMADIAGSIRVMGFKVDGLNIPKELMFDKDGNLDIVGFMICRGERKKRILHQGVAMNCVHAALCDEDVTNDDSTNVRNIIRATPFIQNNFQDGFFNGLTDHHAYVGANSHIGFGGFPNPINGTNFHPDSGCVDGFDPKALYFNKAGWFTVNSPDTSVEGGILESKAGDYLEIAGSMYDPNKKAIQLDGGQFHLYTKSYLSDYRTKREDYTNRSRVRAAYNLNSDMGGFNASLTKIDNYDVKDRFDAYVSIAPELPDNTGYKAWAAPYTSVVLGNDWDAIDLGDDDNPYRFHTVNYCRPNDDYFNDVDFGSRTAIPTGHYQPITKEMLVNVPVVVKNGKEYYQFNGIEVWGGDCYPHLYDFVRLYPQYSYCDTNNINGQKCKRDYSAAMIVPVESNYNMMLRQGRSFAEVATQPEATGCGCSSLTDGYLDHFRKGIMAEQPEDWNINAVLQAQERVKVFNAKPVTYNQRVNADNRWMISQLKTYGELVDSYREFLPLDYFDLDSQYGKIIGSKTLFGSLVSFQEFAYGVLAINPTTAIPASDGVEVIMGTGKNLYGIRYVSDIYGCQHRDSIQKLGNAIYWLDAHNRKICRYSQAGTDNINDLYGYHDFMTTAAFDGRVVGSVDFQNNEYLLSFGGNTHYFAEDINAFTGTSSIAPKFFFRLKDYTFSLDDNNMIFLHNYGKVGELHGKFYNTILRYIVNAESDFLKTFENMAISLRKIGYDKVNKVTFLSDNYSNHVIFVKDELNGGYAKYREGRLVFPMRTIRDANKKEIYDMSERLKGNYVEVEIEIENSLDRLEQVCISDVLTNYRNNYKRVI